MGVLRALKHGPKIKGLGQVAVVVVDVHFAGQFRGAELLHERGAERVAAAVVELEVVLALTQQVSNHRQDGRDANATGHENIRRGVGLQCKQIGPGQGGQQVAFLHGVDHAARAASTPRVALDGDVPAVGVTGQAAQRVAAAHAVGHLHGDVRARGELRQRLCVRMGELEQDNVLCHRLFACNTQGHPSFRGRGFLHVIILAA